MCFGGDLTSFVRTNCVKAHGGSAHYPPCALIQLSCIFTYMAVYGLTRDSGCNIWRYMAVDAVYGCIWTYMAVYGGILLYMDVYGCIRLYMAVCGCIGCI